MQRVIIVDDDATSVGLTKMLLEFDGFAVVGCTSLEQAHSAAEGGAAAFVIDCNLARGMDGLDLLRAIRQGKTGVDRQAVVIVTSGDYRRADEATEAGADHFLLKPFAPSDLSQQLQSLLSKGGLYEA